MDIDLTLLPTTQFLKVLPKSIVFFKMAKKILDGKWIQFFKNVQLMLWVSSNKFQLN